MLERRIVCFDEILLRVELRGADDWTETVSLGGAKSDIGCEQRTALSAGILRRMPNECPRP